MEFEPDQINLDGLEQFAKAVKVSNPPHARIGILAKTNGRDDNGAGNATIGAAHEYGVPSRNLPARSFLRMPLTSELPAKLENAKIFSEDDFNEVLKTGTLVPWLKKIAVLATATVKEAFATNGFGRWAPWRPGYENNTGDILVDTGQLRDSITEEVVE